MGTTYTDSAYYDRLNTNHFVRTFNESVEEDELVWHRDRKDRSFKVLKGQNWKLQMDNETPIVLESGKHYFIKAMEYHRIIKGQGSLVLDIEELVE